VFDSKRYGTGLQPGRVNPLDFNNDGKPDLVVLNQGAGVVTLLENDGKGAFTTVANLAVGASPDRLTTWKSPSGDSRIVVSNGADNSITYFALGTDGKQIGARTVAVGRRPNAMVNIDLDGDGVHELVVANMDDGTVSVVEHEASPAGLPTGVVGTYAVGDGPIALSAAADLNGDGWPDLVVANQTRGGVSVLLNTGRKTFSPARAYSTGTGASSVAVADLNGDGVLDLAVGNGGAAAVSVLINRGDGTFDPKVDYDTAAGPTFPVVADIDGDGIVDLTVSATSGSIVYLKGVGDGTFSPLAKVDLGGAITGRGSAQVMDLDSDGNPDTVVALPFADRIAIVENPDGGFVRLVEYQRRGPLGDAHYFVTPLDDEKRALDAGVRSGWSRTGQSFRAYKSTSPGRFPKVSIAQRYPVCRFFAQAFDSHFYTPSAGECRDVAAKLGGVWGSPESRSLFYAQVPSQTLNVALNPCPASTATVYRLYSNSADINHRYTTSRAIRDAMVASGWLADGPARDGAVMCAP
jgi:hypothetical protein